MPSARSSMSEPVEMLSISMRRFSPMNITVPSPNFFSSCAIAVFSTFSRSAGSTMRTTGLGGAAFFFSAIVCSSVYCFIP